MGLPEVHLGGVLYADSRTIVMNSARRARTVLKLIGRNAVHYGMRLTRAEFEAIVLGDERAEIRFDDGTRVAQPPRVWASCREDGWLTEEGRGRNKTGGLSEVCGVIAEVEVARL